MCQHLLARATNVLLGAAIVVSPQTFGQSDTTSHFHWSERLAHELDYKNTIAVASKLTQKGRAELLAFVLDRFETQSIAMTRTCSREYRTNKCRSWPLKRELS
jgi:hypothetical protein